MPLMRTLPTPSAAPHLQMTCLAKRTQFKTSKFRPARLHSIVTGQHLSYQVAKPKLQAFYIATHQKIKME
eukprot:1009333-Pelagomonas_calceolata.AAC.1